MHTLYMYIYRCMKMYSYICIHVYCTLLDKLRCLRCYPYIFLVRTLYTYMSVYNHMNIYIKLYYTIILP